MKIESGLFGRGKWPGSRRTGREERVIGGRVHMMHMNKLSLGKGLCTKTYQKKFSKRD
jgi:hypothetical protein